ncbi:MAG: HAD-IA family hydrolase [Burkholderiaceae bacterium]|jgi:putative hydrolase of the HAD superfamily
MKPVLVFDIGGVLIENVGYSALRTLMGARHTDEQMLDLWLASRSVQQFESGHWTAEEFGHGIVRELSLEISPKAFLEAFEGWPRDFFPGALELVASLRAEHQVGCLSNSNTLHWRPVFDDIFDFALGSHRMGVVKPNPHAFELLVQRARRPATDIYFFDDSTTNVEAARQAGLRAHHTLGFERLRMVLREEGLL